MIDENEEPELCIEEQWDDFASGRYCRGGYPFCECEGTGAPICEGELQSVIEEGMTEFYASRAD